VVEVERQRVEMGYVGVEGGGEERRVEAEGTRGVVGR